MELRLKYDRFGEKFMLVVNGNFLLRYADNYGIILEVDNRNYAVFNDKNGELVKMVFLDMQEKISNAFYNGYLYIDLDEIIRRAKLFLMMNGAKNKGADE